MTTKEIGWKVHRADIAETDPSPSSGGQKVKYHRLRGMIFLLLRLLSVLIIVTVSCRLPGRGRPANRVLPTFTPIPPTSVLPTPIPPTPALPTPVPVEPVATSLPTSPSADTETSGLNTPGFIFGAGFAVPQDRTFAANTAEIRTAFQSLKALGITAVGQLFNAQTTETDWKAYLDVAAEENMLIIAAFEEAPEWNGQDFDLGINGTFLNAMKDHPALYAFFPVDEPFHRKHNWTITSARLQVLYQQVKGIAPDVLVYTGFSREVWKGEQGQYGPDYVFKERMCDICVISTLEFRNYGQGNRFDRETAIANHSVSRAVIRREDPDVQIWATIQTFGSVATTEGRQGSTYYMPGAEELQQMVDLLLGSELQAAGKLDGIMWQQWGSRYSQQDPSQYTLSDPEFEAQRNIVKETAIRLGLPVSP